MNNWKEYESLIYKIYKELEPHATVRLRDKIRGYLSGIHREIDVSIRSNVAGHDILIIIQAKDHKKRSDVNIIGEFAAVIEDLRASKGILISSAGFTKAGRELAKSKGIDVCSAHDGLSRQWKIDIKVPVIRKSTSVKYNIKGNFVATEEFLANARGGMSIDEFWYTAEFVMSGGRTTTLIDEFIRRWEDNSIEKTNGKHHIDFGEVETLIIKNAPVPANSFKLEYEIKEKNYFKFFTPVEYRGIKNYLTENFKASFISFKEKIPFLNDGT